MIGQIAAIKQGHLFANWETPNITEAQKIKLLDQLVSINAFYGKLHNTPEGLKLYFDNTEAIINTPKASGNIIEPVPQDRITEINSLQDFDKFIMEGIDDFGLSDIVVQAAGAGQRLGYPGIKLSLPITLLNETSYMEQYIRVILAMQAVYNERHPDKPRVIPFIIGTSLDNDTATREFLGKNNYFRQLGVAAGQIQVVRCHEVPAYTLVEGARKSVRFHLYKDDAGVVILRAWQPCRTATAIFTPPCRKPV